MSYFISILFILSVNINPMFGQTMLSATVGDNIVYAACGRLCDKPDMDAITSLSVPTDKQFMVLIVRDGLCSWVLDINEPKQNRDLGRRHHFKYDLVESLYTIFDDPKSSDKYNVTAYFTSGMVSETWRSINGYIKKDSEGPLPLLGLAYNMQNRIDASYGLQPTPESRIVNIIQNDTYYSFDLIAKRGLSGPNSITKDFSYDFKKLGKVQGTFTRGNDIYFFSGSNGYYIWKSKDGKTGSLSEKLSVINDFYNCGTRYTTPKTTTNDLKPSEMTQKRGETTDKPSTPADYPESDGVTESNVRTDGIKNYESSEKVVSESFVDFPKDRTNEETDVNVEPKTVNPSPKADTVIENRVPLNGAHIVLLSLTLSIISAIISILEFISKL